MFKARRMQFDAHNQLLRSLGELVPGPARGRRR